MCTVFKVEIATAHREVAAARQLHDAEAIMLRERIDALQTMVEELSWTAAHAENARKLTAEQLLTQALAAEADVVRRGLVTRLADVCTTGKDDGWCADTDWTGKLSRHIEQLRGSGGSAQICRLFAQAPIFIPRLLTSDAFKLFYEVLCLYQMGSQHFNPLQETATSGGPCADEGCTSAEDAYQLEARMRAEVMTPGDVHRLIKQPPFCEGGANSGSIVISQGSEIDTAKLQAAFRFVRDAAEWGRIRTHLAHTMQLCIRPEGEHGNSRQKIVDMFVSRPASLGLLNLITLQECERGNAADRSTLNAVSEAYVAITAEIALTEGVRGALLKADVVKALAKLLEHVSSIRPALQCIDRLSSDVVSTDFLIGQGLLGPIVFAVGVWSRTAARCAAVGAEAAAEAADAAHVLTELLELLALISRGDSFAPAFDALCGYPTVTAALNVPMPQTANVAAAELLVNLHLVPDQTWNSAAAAAAVAVADHDGSNGRSGNIAADTADTTGVDADAVTTTTCVPASPTTTTGEDDTKSSLAKASLAAVSSAAAESGVHLPLAPDVFRHVFKFSFQAGDAVTARALDVLSSALVEAGSLGKLVTESMLRDVLALVSKGSSALAYKAAYLLQGYAQSQTWNVHIFLKSGAARVLGQFLQDYEGEVRGWMVGVVSRLASAAVAATSMFCSTPDGVTVIDVLAGPAAPIAAAFFEHHDEVTEVVFAAVTLTGTGVGQTLTSKTLWGRAVEAAVLWTVHTHHVVSSAAAAVLVEKRLPSSIDVASALGRLPSSSQVCTALRAVAQVPAMEPLLLKLGKHFVQLLKQHVNTLQPANAGSQVNSRSSEGLSSTIKQIASRSNAAMATISAEDAEHIAACANAVWDRQTVNAKHAGNSIALDGSSKRTGVIVNAEIGTDHPEAKDKGDKGSLGEPVPVESAEDASAKAMYAVDTAGYVQLLVQASALRTKPEGAGALLMRWAGSRFRGSGTFCELVAATPGGVRGVVRLMNHNNSSFAAGAQFLSRLLRSQQSRTRTAVVEQAGLAVLLEVLRLSRDPLLQRAIAAALPDAFDDLEACESVARAGGVVAHLVALVDTCPSNLELSTALRIIRKLAAHERAATAFLRHGGLRVLVEVALIQRYASEDPDHNSLLVDTEPCLLAVLGFGKSASEVIGEEGGAPLLLRLLAESTSPAVVMRTLELLSDISKGPSASSMLDRDGAGFHANGAGVDAVTMWTSGASQRESARNCAAAAARGAPKRSDEGGGVEKDDESQNTGIDRITDILNGGFDIGVPGSLDSMLDSIMSPDNGAIGGTSHGGAGSVDANHGTTRRNAVLLSDAQAATAARLADAATVQLAYNASSIPRGFTQHQTLQAIVEQGGLPAWIAVADPSQRLVGGNGEKALWAIATWLSLDSAESNSFLVRCGGLTVLLAVTNHSTSTAEATRFARVALAKLLCTVGEELTQRISLLSAHIAEKGEADVVLAWEKMSKKA